jgi:hypothetical protein
LSIRSMRIDAETPRLLSETRSSSGKLESHKCLAGGWWFSVS